MPLLKKMTQDLLWKIKMFNLLLLASNLKRLPKFELIQFLKILKEFIKTELKGTFVSCYQRFILWFYGKLYKHVEGVAVGFSLSSTLANVLL